MRLLSRIYVEALMAFMSMFIVRIVVELVRAGREVGLFPAQLLRESHWGKEGKKCELHVDGR